MRGRATAIASPYPAPSASAWIAANAPFTSGLAIWAAISRDADAGDTGRGEVGRDVGDRLVQRDRERDLLVQRRQAGGVDLDEPDACCGEPRPCRACDRRDVRFKAGPERGGDADAACRASGAAAIGVAPVMTASSSATSATVRAHRPDGVARVADRHDGAAPSIAPLRAAVADRRAQADDAAQRGRNARRAAGVGAEAAGDDARGDRDRGAAGRAARNPRAVVRVLTGPANGVRLVLVMPNASSCMLVLPMTIAPASTASAATARWRSARTLRSAGGAAGRRQVARC